ncbi:hypothetical protein [Allobranchiibius sp. GilTou38]|uniref:hypothetical protein n=1 Tax=Allobranchiibius sp. GilTou38 TaxID=2815210 RepID=UPI001AA15244|nr:hypothetical protein [Allobranchiibius sp. GilTou38]MBO1766673.1 hypothetical protein [Allobranchiibius sp. GilTou38]
MMSQTNTQLIAFTAQVCPKAPPGASAPMNDITGYVMWGVIALMGLGMLVGVGGVVAGRVFSMPHASKMSVVGICVVFGAAIAYLVLPGVLSGIVGKGCV